MCLVPWFKRIAWRWCFLYWKRMGRGTWRVWTSLGFAGRQGSTQSLGYKLCTSITSCDSDFSLGTELRSFLPNPRSPKWRWAFSSCAPCLCHSHHKIPARNTLRKEGIIWLITSTDVVLSGQAWCGWSHGMWLGRGREIWAGTHLASSHSLSYSVWLLV